MSQWLRRLLRRPLLADADSNRLAAWCAHATLDRRQTLAAAQWVVADVESSGLDARRDRLISIGAIAVCGGTIRFGQSFEVVLRQPVASAESNILLHGIGGQRQRAGVAPASALLSFLEFAGNSPLIAYHADFDSTLIGRALARELGVTRRLPWLDLALLAPALLGTRSPRARSLDDWLAVAGIRNVARHDAVADALATAQLLLMVLAEATQRKVATIADLAAVADAQRWLNRHR
jgi:DNA polymerase III subunit epsilon